MVAREAVARVSAHESLQLAVLVREADAEIAAALLGVVCGGCEVRDPIEGIATVVVYIDAVPDEEVGAAAMKVLSILPDATVTGFTVERVRDDAWRENWKRHFPPLSVGGRIEVVPPWHEPPVADGHERVVLNPGLAFGTGQHETTAGCLEVLAERVGRGARVADIGCGSGILAIAALKLGAAEAYACDTDPDAVAVTRENAEKNSTTRGLVVERVAEDRDAALPYGAGRYDVVFANILADTLISLRAALTACVADGGSLVLSGIDDAHLPLVEEAFIAPGWTPAKRLLRGPWATLELRRDADAAPGE